VELIGHVRLRLGRECRTSSSVLRLRFGHTEDMAPVVVRHEGGMVQLVHPVSDSRTVNAK
jgi:hypothetical protein